MTNETKIIPTIPAVVLYQGKRDELLLSDSLAFNCCHSRTLVSILWISLVRAVF